MINDKVINLSQDQLTDLEFVDLSDIFIENNGILSVQHLNKIMAFDDNQVIDEDVSGQKRNFQL